MGSLYCANIHFLRCDTDLLYNRSHSQILEYHDGARAAKYLRFDTDFLYKKSHSHILEYVNGAKATKYISQSQINTFNDLIQSKPQSAFEYRERAKVAIYKSDLKSEVKAREQPRSRYRS